MCRLEHGSESKDTKSRLRDGDGAVGTIFRKVWRFSRRGFDVHVHANGASMKGFAVTIAAEMISLLCTRRCFLTFHAGVDQQYFPPTEVYPRSIQSTG